jgi:ankyrin repeat protein
VTDGFDWQSSDRRGSTVLHRAIESGSRELVQALLERGAPVCAPGYGEVVGGAAVHVAGWAGAEPAIWDLLLEHGADINHASDPGTPYDCARMAHEHRTMAVIRERGGLSASELGDTAPAPAGAGQPDEPG